MESRSGSADRQTKAPLSLGELAAVEAASQLETETTRRPRKKKRANNRSGANGIKGGHLINDAGMNQLSDILMESEETGLGPRQLLVHFLKRRASEKPAWAFSACRSHLCFDEYLGEVLLCLAGHELGTSSRTW